MPAPRKGAAPEGMLLLLCLLLSGVHSSPLTPPRRDVKPENIVREGGRAGGRVYLVDFGGVQVWEGKTNCLHAGACSGVGLDGAGVCVGMEVGVAATVAEVAGFETSVSMSCPATLLLACSRHQRILNTRPAAGALLAADATPHVACRAGCRCLGCRPPGLHHCWHVRLHGSRAGAEGSGCLHAAWESAARVLCACVCKDGRRMQRTMCCDGGGAAHAAAVCIPDAATALCSRPSQLLLPP